MYQHPGSLTAAGLTGGAGTLAYTGVNAIWLVLAGFALLAAGSALLRISPKIRSRSTE